MKHEIRNIYILLQNTNTLVQKLKNKAYKCSDTPDMACAGQVCVRDRKIEL